ncbi:MAG: hypothetical protein CSA50_06580 [Gammaproteobacteria bacterium]|nr:MAG: hypothetical protein CSA50_06580 [Gammaproteobacteria bacterium]
MNIIFVSKRYGRPRSIEFSARSLVLFALLLLVLLATGFFIGMNSYAFIETDRSQEELAGGSTHLAIQAWGKELAEYRKSLQAIESATNGQIDAMTVRIGEIQARMMRIEALGQRLTAVAKLTKGEFDFEAAPAVGGPMDTQGEQTYAVTDLQSMMDVLEAQLDNRFQQLQLMDKIFAEQSAEQQLFISGRPIKKGWMSSAYGYRADPFNGKRTWHSGVDFAGKDNSDIVAVAGGVVTWSQKRHGYGNLIEISHGGKIATRYAHCKNLLVKVGDIVEKGQVIAKMGSTGRSTGPHVHFEVLVNGRSVNPRKYIYRASR